VTTRKWLQVLYAFYIAVVGASAFYMLRQALLGDWIGSALFALAAAINTGNAIATHHDLKGG
jgi:hypothetical protein